MPQMSQSRGEAAGVPYVALPPEQAVEEAPLVVTWHLASPPRSETAMAAALPLRGLGAWRVHLGLPMLGTRLPEGGLEEFLRLFGEDMVLNQFDPITRRAVEEFPAALAELRDRLPVGDGPLGLVGGSLGAWVAQSVLAETDVPVSTVALVSPAIRAASVVARYERWWEFHYQWSERSLAIANRLDFVARAPELADRDVATLLVVGAEDDEEGFRQPAEQLRQELSRRSPQRAALVQVPGMSHALAEEPGLEPAPQTAHAARVDAAVIDWFREHLVREQVAPGMSGFVAKVPPAGVGARDPGRLGGGSRTAVTKVTARSGHPPLPGGSPWTYVGSDGRSSERRN